MTDGHPGNVVEAGFSLVELLVVLAILAMLALVALPRVASPSDGVRLRTTSADLVGALRLARAAAIARNTEITLVIDVDKRTAETAVAPMYRFGPDVVAELRIAEPEQTTKSRGAFRFFADGSSTGGDIFLRLAGHKARICVDWLTGRARQSGEC